MNREAWLSAVASVEPKDDQGAMTVAELMELFACKRATARFRIQLLVDGGKAAQTTKRIIDRMGRVQSVTAYRLVEAKKPATTKRKAS